MVNASFDPAFQKLADEKAQLEGEMQKCLEACKKDVGLPKEGDVKLVEHQEGRICFRVVKKNHGQVMKKTGAYESISLKKAEFIFTSDKLTGLNKKMRQNVDSYEEAQKDLVAKACKIAATYIPVLEKLANLLSSLDVLGSFALVSSCSQSDFCRPNISDGRLCILGISLYDAYRTSSVMGSFDWNS